jgi:hypothetical protein
VVDFEAAGWDDSARLVMGFVARAAREDLALSMRACAEACKLPDTKSPASTPLERV